jgi:8-oxo-dGTP pyrophosphatase MutT (NUDIX family)
MRLDLSDDDPRLVLLGLLARHGHAVAAARPAIRQFREFALAHRDCFERACAPGHFTGSAWLVDSAGERVLLTHHRKLDRWLQLGGHADGDADLARVALREAGEESGLVDLVVEPAIFDLDRHLIPARANEPAQWHYDVRFVVHATGSDRFTANEESHELGWRRIADVADDESLDRSLRRMARRWLARKDASSNTIPTQPSP